MKTEIIVAVISMLGTLSICLINNYFQMKKIKIEQQKITEEQMKALKLGVQALLRDRLLSEYEYWNDKGYCPYLKKQNVDNMHTQYATLGSNGIMDEAHKKFMKLPLDLNKPQNEENI